MCLVSDPGDLETEIETRAIPFGAISFVRCETKLMMSYRYSSKLDHLVPGDSILCSIYDISLFGLIPDDWLDSDQVSGWWVNFFLGVANENAYRLSNGSMSLQK